MSIEYTEEDVREAIRLLDEQGERFAPEAALILGNLWDQLCQARDDLAELQDAVVAADKADVLVQSLVRGHR